MINLEIFAIFTSLLLLCSSILLLYIFLKQTSRNSFVFIDNVKEIFYYFQRFFLTNHLLVSAVVTISFTVFIFLTKDIHSFSLIFSFLNACFLFLILGFTNIAVFPKIISQVERHYSQFFNTGFLNQAILSFLMIMINISGTLFVIFSNVFFLGHKSSIGFLFGFGLSAFILRISTSYFNVSTSLSAPKLKSNFHLNDPELNNPTSYLKVSSIYLSKSLGFNFDLIHSMIFSLIAALFVALFYQNSFMHFLPDFSILYNTPIMIIVLILLSNIISFVVWLVQKKNLKQKKCYLPLYYSLFFSSIFVSMYLIFLYKILNLHFLAIFTYIFLPFFWGVLLSFLLTLFAYNQSAYSKKMIIKLLESSLLSSCFTFFQLERLRNKAWFFQLFLFLLFGYLTYFSSGFVGLSFVALGYFSITPCVLFLSTLEGITNSTLRYLNLSHASSIPKKHLLFFQHQINSTAGLYHSFSSQAAILAVIGLFFSLFFNSSSSYSYIFKVDISFMVGLSSALLFISLFRYFLLKPFSILSKTIITEVKRQFIELPLLSQNKVKPDTLRLSTKVFRAIFFSIIIPAFLLIFIPFLLSLINLKILYAYCFFLFFFVLQETYCMSIVAEGIISVINMLKNGHYGGDKTETFSHLNQHKLFNEGQKDVMLPALSILLKTSILVALLITFLLN